MVKGFNVPLTTPPEPKRPRRRQSFLSRLVLFQLSLLWSGAFAIAANWAYRQEPAAWAWFTGLEWYLQALFGPILFVAVAIPVAFVGFNIVLVPLITALWMMGAFAPSAYAD